ncbi:MAG: hypothetical protein CVU30_06690 [Betaproteobacteria bacterium HGW-Betaproteobacteria-3]|jgi:cyclopropane-fatty-acyl-phospholipid synthase|nr:MAG: hypothetical protein CVU30_06690 [Betaproteobacteria bacterium HGW-Betaproteobacteria-3]
MALFSLEHSALAYRADFALYGTASVTMAAVMMTAGPADQRVALTLLALLGLASWTLIEYLLHRFVLHGLQPFSQWHSAHHQRPTALICTPALFSAGLIVTLVFLPAFLWAGGWRACALTFGVVLGYLGYAVAHHATHHWRSDTPWVKRRKYWHALHHRAGLRPSHFGVTTAFWDRVLGSDGRLS